MKENKFKENFKRAKNLYNALKKDGESILFASKKINKQLIKKIKRSKYEKDIIFLELYNNIKNVKLDEKEEIPTFVPFIENKKYLIIQLCTVLMVLFNYYMLKLLI